MTKQPNGWHAPITHHRAPLSPSMKLRKARSSHRGLQCCIFLKEMQGTGHPCSWIPEEGEVSASGAEAAWIRHPDRP